MEKKFIYILFGCLENNLVIFDGVRVEGMSCRFCLEFGIFRNTWIGICNLGFFVFGFYDKLV